LKNSKGYERTLILVLFFTWGTVFLDRMSQLYLAPYFAPEFHLTTQQIGGLAAVLAICWAASGFFFGAVSDRIGRRAVLLPAVVVFSLLSWLSGLAQNFEQLLLVRGLMGLAEGPCWPVITALIEESSFPRRRGRNVGIVVSAGALVGLAVAPVLTTQIAARFGWRWAFFVAGIPGLVIAVLILRFVREPPAGAANGSHSHRQTLSEALSLFRYRNIRLCAIGAIGFMTWLFVENAFAPLYITRVAHQSATTAGFLLGASGMGSFVLGFLLPALSDRIGRKRLLMTAALLSMIVPLALHVGFLYQHLWLLATIVLLTNGGQCMPALVMVLVPAESVPRGLSATAIGLVTLVGEIIGATVSPGVAGSLAARYGLGACLWFSAGGAFLVFLSSLLLKETLAECEGSEELDHMSMKPL
jgi:MFS family permease